MDREEPVRKYKGHTPGEWRRSSLAPLYIIAGNEPKPICSLGEYDEDSKIDVVFNNAKANARLIADAPKLLEQRDRLLAALRKIGYDPFGAADASAQQVLDQITELARTVIAEVEGQ